MGHMAHSTHGQNTNANAVGMMLVGAMAGALAALLLAPKRGTEMRDDIRGRYNDMMAKTHDTMDKAADKMKEGTERLRSKTHDVADQAKSAADKAADKTQDMADETQDRVAASRRRRSNGTDNEL